MKFKDSRIKMMNEILNGMKVRSGFHHYIMQEYLTSNILTILHVHHVDGF